MKHLHMPHVAFAAVFIVLAASFVIPGVLS